MLTSILFALSTASAGFGMDLGTPTPPASSPAPSGETSWGGISVDFDAVDGPADDLDDEEVEDRTIYEQLWDAVVDAAWVYVPPNDGDVVSATGVGLTFDEAEAVAMHQSLTYCQATFGPDSYPRDLMSSGSMSTAQFVKVYRTYRCAHPGAVQARPLPPRQGSVGTWRDATHACFPNQPVLERVYVNEPLTHWSGTREYTCRTRQPGAQPVMRYEDGTRVRASDVVALVDTVVCLGANACSVLSDDWEHIVDTSGNPF
ncbi:MAG: hypothetical protein KC656_25415 [Myxococcales bacterium]|nr:hypothetical protein [Myxococcales bacterium]